MQDYELVVLTERGTKRAVTQSGANGLDACQRYANAHPGDSVTAWQEAERHGVFVYGGEQIIEPGHHLWGKGKQ